MADPTTATLKSLIELVGTISPETTEGLRAGAKATTINELEGLIGVNFDETFRALYTLHDGQNSKSSAGFFYGLEFLSIEGIIQQWESWVSILNDPMDWDMHEFCTSHHKGKVKKLYANTKWVPFAFDWGGNHLGIDFDPDESGTVGQIINFGSDEETKYVIAESFAAFIDWYDSELRKGNYEIDEAGSQYGFNTKAPKSEHFLDAVKTLFA